MRKMVAVVACPVLALLALVSPSLAEPGSLDPSFGGDGMVTTSFGPYLGLARGEAVAIQGDGRMLVAGSDGNPAIRAGVRFAVARYKLGGSLDATFGNDGLRRTSFPSGNAYGADVAVQADGRIVLAGTAGDEFALARYNPNGSLNRAFGSDGMVTTSFGRIRSAAGDAVAIQRDGRILVAGTADREFALARYDSEGSLDPSFGGDGKVLTNDRGSDEVFGIALQADGKIVVAGRSGYGGFALARYRSDGSLDRSFGHRGTVRTIFGPAEAVVRASAEDVVIQADGKIVAAGWAGGNFVRTALARYRSDGTPDRSFGSDGRVRTDFGQGAESTAAVIIQADGAIVAGGMAADFHEFAVARYLTDGSLDPNFGIGGRVVTAFRHGDAVANAVVIQANGKLILAGERDGEFALARYFAS